MKRNHCHDWCMMDRLDDEIWRVNHGKSYPVALCKGKNLLWWVVWKFRHLSQRVEQRGTNKKGWFGTWILYSHSVGNFIIPTDELIFFRGVGLNHQPVLEAVSISESDFWGIWPVRAEHEGFHVHPWSSRVPHGVAHGSLPTLKKSLSFMTISER